MTPIKKRIQVLRDNEDFTLAGIEILRIIEQGIEERDAMITHYEKVVADYDKNLTQLEESIQKIINDIKDEPIS